MSEQTKLLLLDDRTQNSGTLFELLESQHIFTDYHTVRLDSFDRLTLLTPDECPSLIILLIEVPDETHLETLGAIKRQMPNIPIILCAAMDNDAFAIMALKAGAQDFLVLNEQQQPSIDRAIQFAITRSDKLNTIQKILDQKEFESTYDALTGLANKQLVSDRLAHTISNAHRYQFPFAVLAVGIDNLHQFVQTLGMKATDALIKAISTRLSSRVRASDTIGRIADNQFLIIVSQLRDSNDSIMIAEHLLELFNKSFTVEQREVFVSSSIGIARYPEDGTDADTLMRASYAAQQAVKQDGSNAYQVYVPQLSNRNDRQLILSNDLHHALAKQQFELYYQPQVNIAQQRITGFEALIRWQHPEFGIVGPDEFIGIAESKGMMMQISEWVMTSACQQLSIWRQMGFTDLVVSVNISAREFEHPQFIDKLQHILDQFGVPASNFGLELTESTIMHDPGMAAKTLHDLKHLGVYLAIDDFGTGYSSLSYLKDFPMDTLKMDRSFTKDLIINKENTNIVKAILALAQSLGLRVIAEGVENKLQMDCLIENGCHYMQGYLFSRPEPVINCESILKHPESIIQ